MRKLILARQHWYWLLFLAILLISGYGLWIFLSGQLFDLMLWQKLILDPDHRWKPHERVDINSDGLRSYEEAGNYKPTDFNVIISGDSFTFGHLLPPEASPPAQFELLARQAYPHAAIHVINFGWSSSSPYLSLRLLKDKAAKYHPKLVLFLLDATDYKDDYFYSHVIEKSGNYKFIVEHPLLAHFPRKIAGATDKVTGWHQKMLGYPYSGNYFLFFQPYEQSVPFFDYTYHNLELMNAYVTQELHAKFIVFIPPRHWQYTDKESPLSWERHNYTALGPYVLNNYVYFDAKAKTASFPIVSLLEDFKSTKVFPTTFERDSHWNPDGAKLAAQLMLEHCKTLHCFGPGSQTP